MFLVIRVFSVARLAAIVIVIGWSQLLRASDCVVDLSVYDSSGNRLPFTVTRITSDRDLSLNLLGPGFKVFKFNVVGRLLVLDRSIIGHTILVTLRGPTGTEISERVALMHCPQRVSIRHGNASKYGDVEFQTVSGRLTGCRFDGDWWIRGMPMFGAAAHVAIPEGLVESDGAFVVVGAFSGSRHLFVVGRGNSAVKVIAANIVEARANTLGVIDVKEACPK